MQSEAGIRHHEQRPRVALRQAVPDDAEQLALLYKNTWRATYPSDEHGVTQQDIYEKTKNWGGEADIEKRRQKILSSAEDENVFSLVADIDGYIAGHSILIQYPDKEHNKLQTLYVHPDCQGGGIGSALIRKGLEWLGEEKPIALEVAKYNEQAIHTYQKFGFEIRGDAKSPVADLPSGAVIPEFNMAKPAAED